MRFAFSLLALTVSPFLVGMYAAPVLARQSQPQTTISTAPERPMLLDVPHYKPQSQGPLLWIGPAERVAIPSTREAEYQAMFGSLTMQQFADKLEVRFVHSGNLSALVPATMRVMSKSFGKADPFAGMSRSDQAKIFFSLLSREQWQMLGSKNGIGISDMTDEQRSLFAHLVGDNTLTVRHEVVEPNPAIEGLMRVKERRPTESVPAAGTRLRVSQRAQFMMETTNNKGKFPSPVGTPYEVRTTEANDVLVSNHLEIPQEKSGNSAEAIYSFGAPVIQIVPNHLKPGQLDLDNPSLTVPILLDGSKKTVGELIRQIARTANIPLTSDVIYDRLAVSYRVAPGGQSVYAGDLLKMICRSVTGTFRRLDTPTGPLYLLTDDVEGVGTRMGRLNRWARKAEEVRREALQKAFANCRKQDPLDFLQATPDDPLALSGTQIKQINAAYRKSERSIPVSYNELSPTLRNEFDRIATSLSRTSNSTSINRSQLEITTQFHSELILPDGRAFPFGLLDPEIDGNHFFQRIGEKVSYKDLRPSDTNVQKPFTLPSMVKRRVLIGPLPADKTEAGTLFTAMKKKGFTEAWFTVPPTDAAAAQLSTLIAFGQTRKISVGAVVSWISHKEADPQGREDINIFGETSDQWYKTSPRVSSDEGSAIQRNWDRRFAGNLVPGSEVTLRRCVAIAKTPGLCALVLDDAMPPGWAGWTPSSDMLSSDARLGYTVETRLACLRARGFDPVDIADRTREAGISASVLAPNSSERETVLAEFRRQQNAAYLQTIHTRLHTLMPGLSLYLTTPANFFAARSYAIRWTDATRIPEVDDTVDDITARGTAFRLSSEPLFMTRGTIYNSERDYFRERMINDMKLIPNWRGYVFDAQDYSAPEVITLLSDFADATT